MVNVRYNIYRKKQERDKWGERERGKEPHATATQAFNENLEMVLERLAQNLLAPSPFSHPAFVYRCNCVHELEAKASPRTRKRIETETFNTRKMSHIAVERIRRRQMNEHLRVLRSLTPCFYIKRGDQASIIGGVTEFIKELHQVLQSLESKKRRKSLSPSPSPSPRQLQLTPPPPPDSPLGLENVKELGACCNSHVADVEAKICGSNVILRTTSKRIPGQVVKISFLLEKLAFEILHISIRNMEDTVLHSFVIKIGLECQLSVEDLAVKVQQSFYQDVICMN